MLLALDFLFMLFTDMLVLIMFAGWRLWLSLHIDHSLLNILNLLLEQRWGIVS
jgi:hypothetical protein